MCRRWGKLRRCDAPPNPPAPLERGFKAQCVESGVFKPSSQRSWGIHQEVQRSRITSPLRARVIKPPSQGGGGIPQEVERSRITQPLGFGVFKPPTVGGGGDSSASRKIQNHATIGCGVFKPPCQGGGGILGGWGQFPSVLRITGNWTPHWYTGKSGGGQSCCLSVGSRRER